MSYILDALRKSEIERQRGSVPGLQTPQETVPDVRKKRPLLSLLLLLMLLLSAVLLIWHSPWQAASPDHGAGMARNTVQPLDRPSQPGASVGMNSRRAPPAVSEEDQGIHQELAENRPPGHDSPGAAGINAGMAPAIPHAGQHVPVTGTVVPETHPKQKAAVDPQVAATEDMSARDEQAPQSVPNINALDFSVSSRLPDITFAGHVYADQPAARMVMINNRMYHEGARITGDLILEEITPTGAVFRFRGQRFQMNVMQTWSKH